MGARDAMVGVLLVLWVSTAVFAESPPEVENVKPRPPACPRNEVRRCQNTCPPDFCITLYAAFDCIANQTCVYGCYCKEGYLRIGRNGPCVPKDECPPVECVDDPNARRGCGDTCGKTCGDYNKNPVCPKRPCKNDGCDCKEGYIHDTNTNNCVLPKDCTTNCNGEHERYIDCLAGQCGPKRCEDLDESIACPFIVGPCPGGCICEEGYLRYKGKCIKIEDCPPKPCRGNQTWMSPCNAPCPYPRCPRDDKPPPPPCQVLQPCYPGCQCSPGYKRNSTGHCILDSDCPHYCKDPNASWKECRDICPGTCQNPNPICISKIVCRPGCQCNKGYVLDKTGDGGICVKIETCPATTTSPPTTTMCTPAPPKCTKPNEQWTDCLPGQCRPKTCDELRKPAPCPRIMPPCPGGCICRDGYVRNAEGKCIKKENCPNQCNKPHERWSDCYLAECFAKTCDELGQSLPCPDIEPPCDGGCICEKGYVRDKNGTCIDAKTCPPNKCGKNEEFYCGPSCPDSEASCSNPNPPICINKRCEFKCFCKKGYVRDTNNGNVCIPADKCPKKCKLHERWTDCYDGECVAKSCDDLGKPLPCPGIVPPCAGGCICEKGYVRDENGICINAKKCPRCGEDPNAETGCGNPCGRTCANLRANSRRKRDTASAFAPACATYCKVNGCDCKEGYILNTDVNPPRCVLPEDCNKPPSCKDPNATWVNCRDICPGTCENPRPICMSKMACSPGCQCKKGYVLDKAGAGGKCVKLETCPCA